jgi:cytochrome c oxidase subunit 3
VVLAWSSLKMNRFDRYKIYQSITIICAILFLCIKSFEYNDKFHHYEIIKKDGTVVDGHLIEKTKDYYIIHPLPKPIKKSMESEAMKEAQAAASSQPATGAEAGHAGEEAHVKVMVTDIAKAENYGPWHNTYLAIYFTLTGLHALHVFGGALVIFYILVPGAKMWKTDPERYTNRIEVSGLFWHFVDLVWIFLFPVLYLL